MSGQFGHLEQYARVASKLTGVKGVKKDQKRATVKRRRLTFRESLEALEDMSPSEQITDRGHVRKNWTAREILAEVLREPHACMHVPAPRPPHSIYGDVQDLADGFDELEEKLRRHEAGDGPNPYPPRFRKDTPILLAGVFSAPWAPDDPRSAAWHEDNLRFLKDWFGGNLRAVVVHEDEPYAHCHFYITAPGLLSVKPLHPGQVSRAGADAKEEVRGKYKLVKGAYSAGMVVWQDAYYQTVSRHWGLERKGPSRERLSRDEWKARKAKADQIARAELLRREQEESARQRAAKLDAAAEAMCHANSEIERIRAIQADSAEGMKRTQHALQQRQAGLEARAAGLAVREEAVKAAAGAVKEREVALSRREQLVNAFVAKARDLVAGVWSYLTGFQRDEMNADLRALQAAEVDLHPERGPAGGGKSGLPAPAPKGTQGE